MDKLTEDVKGLCVETPEADSATEVVSEEKPEISETTEESGEAENEDGDNDTDTKKETEAADEKEDETEIGCDTSQNVEISFKVPYDDDYTSPYVALGGGFEDSYKNCEEKDEVVITAEMITVNTDAKKYVTLWLEYPFDDEYDFKIYPRDPSKGFTRGELIRVIKQTYDRCYAEEEDSSTEPVTNIPGMLNRATTNGNYGIWGHGLDDLVLHTIEYNPLKNIIWLGIDS